MARRPLAPSAAFVDPVFLAALGVLAVNDHLLKGAGVLPAVVTGKLSDVAGLIVAPAVAAWVLRVRSGGAWLAVHAAVGAAFAALQVPAVVAGLGAVVPLVAWPDPTDLAALPALALSFARFGRPAQARPAAVRLALGALALGLCAASSMGSPPPRYPFPAGGDLLTDVFFRHPGAAPQVVTVDRVRDGHRLPDCARVLEDPAGALAGVPFDHRQEWTLAEGDAVPLWNRRAEARDRACYAVRLTVQGRPGTWLLAWQHGAPAVRRVPVRLEAGAPAEEDAVRYPAALERPRAPAGVALAPAP